MQRDLNSRLQSKKVGHSQQAAIYRRRVLDLEGPRDRPPIKPNHVDIFDGLQGRRVIVQGKGRNKLCVMLARQSLADPASVAGRNPDVEAEYRPKPSDACLHPN